MALAAACVTVRRAREEYAAAGGSFASDFTRQVLEREQAAAAGRDASTR
jgi:hypothetical protein